MFLLNKKLIPFSFKRAKEYEFMAKNIKYTNHYLLYFRRPGDYFWKKIIKANGYAMVLPQVDVLQALSSYSNKPDQFEAYYGSFSYNKPDVVDNKTIIITENRAEKLAEKTMNEALE